MIFNPDLSKQSQEVIFSKIIKKLLHPMLLFGDILLSDSLFPKHPGLTLDTKLNFSEHIKSIIKEKTVKLWVFYKTFKKFCQSHLFSLYIKL